MTLALDTASPQEGSNGEGEELAAPVGAAAVMISIAVSTLAPASAANSIRAFGRQETLNDYVTGAPMIGYTVSGLSPSSDTMPYPVNGRLYEATVDRRRAGGLGHSLDPTVQCPR